MKRGFFNNSVKDKTSEEKITKNLTVDDFSDQMKKIFGKYFLDPFGLFKTPEESVLLEAGMVFLNLYSGKANSIPENLSQIFNRPSKISGLNISGTKSFNESMLTNKQDLMNSVATVFGYTLIELQPSKTQAYKALIQKKLGTDQLEKFNQTLLQRLHDLDERKFKKSLDFY